MPLADYSHWNEEAPMIWWEEEGKHQDSSEPEYTEDDYDNPDFPFRDSTWDEDDTEKCTCTYGSYVKYAGGTGFDIAKYDPDCPEHGG